MPLRSFELLNLKNSVYKGNVKYSQTEKVKDAIDK